jgi:transcriptional regulator with XRE-family HTH domain
MTTAVKSDTSTGWTSPDIAARFQSRMAEHRQTLARRIRLLREARGWSKEKLALEAGLSGKHIGRLEAGLVEKPTEDTYNKLADAFKIPVTDLDAAGRPSLAELEEADGPLERIEKQLAALSPSAADGSESQLESLREAVAALHALVSEVLRVALETQAAVEKRKGQSGAG